MNQPALFFNGIYIYWHGIFMTGAIALAAVTALLAGASMRRKLCPVLLDAALLAVPLGLLPARLLYCFCNYEEFSSVSEVFRLSHGGYGLYGAILGVFLAAAIVNRLRRAHALGAFCDCLALGGALGIAAGRLTGWFSLDNIGDTITNPRFQRYPFAVYSSVSGSWALATFNLEALFELLIFAVLCVLFFRGQRDGSRTRRRDGDLALLFLLFHGASQAVFDSMHMDCLRLPGNSFVPIQQVLGAVCLTAVMICFTVRSVRVNGFKLYHIAALSCFFGMIGLVLYLVLGIRVSDANYFLLHGIMLPAMLCDAVIGFLIYRTTLDKSSAAQTVTAEGMAGIHQTTKN